MFVSFVKWFWFSVFPTQRKIDVPLIFFFVLDYKITKPYTYSQISLFWITCILFTTFIFGQAALSCFTLCISSCRLDANFSRYLPFLCKIIGCFVYFLDRDSLFLLINFLSFLSDTYYCYSINHVLDCWGCPSIFNGLRGVPLTKNGTDSLTVKTLYMYPSQLRCVGYNWEN